MENLLFQWAGRLRPLLIAVLLPTLTAACAGDGMPQYRDKPVAQVEEDRELTVVETTDGFLDTAGRNAEEFAEIGSKVTAVVGCVAGGIALIVVVADAGSGAHSEGVFKAACMVGWIALYPVGYALGYSTGAVVGTVQGVAKLFAERR